MFQKFLSSFFSGTRTLKTQLAIYFIPVTILPTIAISYYATRMFQETATENLVRRAVSEREAIVSEVDNFETSVLERVRKHAKDAELVGALRQRDRSLIERALSSFQSDLRLRVYQSDGEFLVRRAGAGSDPQVAYISKEGIRRVKTLGETLDRYFADDGKGFVIVTRSLIRDRFGVYGILEEESAFSDQKLGEIKLQRGLDVVFLNRDFTKRASSIAIEPHQVQELTTKSIQPNLTGRREATILKIADARYAAFLFDLPAQMGKQKYWGYVAVLLSMTPVDAMTQKLKVNLILTTAFLILSFALLNFLFSNRIVKPLEILVYAMKRAKTGRVEQIPPIDSAYEIEYLVRAFNDMIRNVSEAKKTLEEKLTELKKANQEIKNTQTTLVQSAKMISLGQIVAGVAHELNNPIGFIYSNMHHLQEYVEKLETLVKEYRALRLSLPNEQARVLEKIEKDLDIDFVLKDIDSLTKSCVDGARRTKEIVLGLRTFSRMDESVFRFEDIHEGIRSTLKLLVNELKNKITIHEEFGDLPMVECTLSQINQVLVNLITNAAHAIEAKGEIWIRTRREGENVLIEIQDTGSGMSPQTVEKIFDPFFTTKKVGQGTGLGLSIAYGLIEKHHGKISVKSELGRGTTFVIQLPIQQPVQKAG